ncbi:MAG: GNAT family N-acetyltransferase [Rhodothermales bacterium]
MPAVRRETAEDRAAVRDVNERAFGRAAEADLVEALRHAARPYLSLVAEEEGQVVGHILFSPVEVESEGGAPAVMGLAPMAVLPERQRRGIGSALVREGLQACRQMGIQAVVVLGHRAYYPRFGFEPAGAYGLQSEYDVPAEAFMVIEFSPRVLEGLGGVVKYHAAFNEVE